MTSSSLSLSQLRARGALHSFSGISVKKNDEIDMGMGIGCFRKRGNVKLQYTPVIPINVFIY